MNRTVSYGARVATVTCLGVLVVLAASPGAQAVGKSKPQLLAVLANSSGGNPENMNGLSSDGTKLVYLGYPAGSQDAAAYVKDLATGQTSLVSAAADGTPANSSVQKAVFSPDGRVLLVARATNLVPALAGRVPDGNTGYVFLKDIHSGAVTLVSAAADGTPGDGPTEEAAVSGDGRYAVMESQATNLGPASSGKPSIYLKDLASGQVRRADITADGTAANGDCFNPAVSRNGTKVAFDCYNTTTLVAGTSGRYPSVFVKDMTTGAVTLASASRAGAPANGMSMAPQLSPDGTRVGFISESNNLAGREKSRNTWDLFIKNLTSGTVKRVASGNDISPNWKHVAYPSRDSKGREQVWIEAINGKHRHQLTNFSGRGAGTYFGSFTPDSKYVIVTYARLHGDAKIYKVKL